MARLVHHHVELLWTRWSSRSVLFASPLVKEDDQQIQDSTNHTLNAAKRRILIKVSAPKYKNVKCESRKQKSLRPWRENDTLQYVIVGLYKHTADSATTHKYLYIDQRRGDETHVSSTRWSDSTQLHLNCSSWNLYWCTLYNLLRTKWRNNGQWKPKSSTPWGLDSKSDWKSE